MSHANFIRFSRSLKEMSLPKQLPDFILEPYEIDSSLSTNLSILKTHYLPGKALQMISPKKNKTNQSPAEKASFSNIVEAMPAKKPFIALTPSEIKMQGRLIGQYYTHLPNILSSKEFEYKLLTHLWKVTRMRATKRGQVHIGYSLNDPEEPESTWVTIFFNIRKELKNV
jgi:hypothetical protein